ncbi:hypothetical protein BKA63DRAFT_498584 [Paraphoma chrysanthemicola]|nr:hypothetical protein BKA63DRAFT_498584 [Paraphoma chrysanthemicola]
MTIIPLLTLALTSTLSFAHAAPIPPSQNSFSSSSSWSKQDIITLIGVLVAVLGILLTLLLASPTLRRKLLYPCRCKPRYPKCSNICFTNTSEIV